MMDQELFEQAARAHVKKPIPTDSLPLAIKIQLAIMPRLETLKVIRFHVPHSWSKRTF